VNGLAYRRHQRTRFLARTRRMMLDIWRLAPDVVDRLAVRWCQNRRKCSCYLCSREGPPVQEQKASLWDIW
jgi:hypothetical protein